jgi:hypothetical protein
MVFCPVYDAIDRFYKVKFYEGYNNQIILQNGEEEYLVKYNTEYDGPIKNYSYRDSSSLSDTLRYGFKGWSTTRYSDNDKPLNFEGFNLSTPITDNIVLYSYYEIEDVHEVATSEEYFDITSDGTISMKDKYKEVLEGKITIPSKVNNIVVKAIGQMHTGVTYTENYIEIYRPSKITHYYFLQDCTATKVISNAFAGHPTVRVIELPDSIVEIQTSAFLQDKSLETLKFGKNLAKVGSSICMSCSRLKNINIPQSLTRLSDSMFWNCSALEMDALPEWIESIGTNCFTSCANIRITDFGSDDDSVKGLKEIGAEAFYSAGAKQTANLNTLTLRKSIETVGQKAFRDYGSFSSNKSKTVYLSKLRNEYGSDDVISHAGINAEGTTVTEPA